MSASPWAGWGPTPGASPSSSDCSRGRPCPPREAIEAAAAPLFSPIDDLRASAAFKRYRAAALLADALHDAFKELSK